MTPTEIGSVALVAAAAAAAAVVVIRQRSSGSRNSGSRNSVRALGALAGIALGTALWWLTGAFVVWIVFLVVGGLVGVGIERRVDHT
jgi:hypothetical protein